MCWQHLTLCGAMLTVCAGDPRVLPVPAGLAPDGGHMALDKALGALVPHQGIDRSWPVVPLVRPPRRGLVVFPFACSENVSQTSLPTEVLPFSSAFRAPGAEPAEPEPAERASKGGRERAAGGGCRVSQVKSPRRPRWPLSGSPTFCVPSL